MHCECRIHIYPGKPVSGRPKAFVDRDTRRTEDAIHQMNVPRRRFISASISLLQSLQRDDSGTLTKNRSPVSRCPRGPGRTAGGVVARLRSRGAKRSRSFARPRRFSRSGPGSAGMGAVREQHQCDTIRSRRPSNSNQERNSGLAEIRRRLKSLSRAGRRAFSGQIVAASRDARRVYL